ncbi:MAG: DNA alkylation repair protein [Armatimonadetes bacterium]|nr:DNA alkylation repair protein [Armatimonadota bacterium]
MDFVHQVQHVLEPARNPAFAEPMKRYMKNHFDFLGLKRPEMAALMRPLLKETAKQDEDWLLDQARQLWNLPEREYQYAAIDLLARNQKRLTVASLPLLQEMIETKCWWDSNDAISGHILCPMALRIPEVTAIMDKWNESENFWLVRVSILYQRGHKAATDEARLFRYCLRWAGSKEFFLRKGIGWALREYAKTNRPAVEAFLAQHGERFSGLTLREALRPTSAAQRRAISC